MPLGPLKPVEAMADPEVGLYNAVLVDATGRAGSPRRRSVMLKNQSARSESKRIFDS